MLDYLINNVFDDYISLFSNKTYREKNENKSKYYEKVFCVWYLQSEVDKVLKKLWITSKEVVVYEPFQINNKKEYFKQMEWDDIFVIVCIGRINKHPSKKIMELINSGKCKWAVVSKWLVWLTVNNDFQTNKI